LLQANDVKEAFENTVQIMDGTMGDYSIPMIMESSIMDVFPYFSGEEDDLEMLEKFNAAKGSKPELAAVGETDFSIEEEEEAVTERL
jgi:hypothetical protein